MKRIPVITAATAALLLLATAQDATAHCTIQHPSHCIDDAAKIPEKIPQAGRDLNQAVLQFGRDFNQWAIKAGKDVNQATLKAGRDTNRWWNDPDGCEKKKECYTLQKPDSPTGSAIPPTKLASVTLRVYCKDSQSGESRGVQDLITRAPTQDEATKKAWNIYERRDVCRYGINDDWVDNTREQDFSRPPEWVGRG